MSGAVVRGIAYSSFGNALQRLFDVAIAFLLLASLSIYDYGLYTLVLAAYGFWTIVFLPALENVIITDIAGDRVTKPEQARMLYSVYAFLLIVMAVVLWALFFWWGQLFSYWVDGNTTYLASASWLFLLSPIETLLRIRTTVQLEFGWMLAYRILRSVARLIFLSLTIVYTWVSVDMALMSSIVASAFALACVIFWYQPKRWFIVPTGAAFSLFWFRTVRTHGKWALVEDSFNSVVQSIHPFLIRLFLGIEAVAIVALASNLNSYAKAAFPVRDVLFPIFPLADDTSQLSRYIGRLLKYSTLGYICIGLVAACTAPVVTHVLLPKYETALPLFYILLLSLPFFGIRSVAVPVFYNLKAQRSLFKITFLRSMLSLGIAIAIIPLLGMVGVGFWMVLTAIITALSYLREIRRRLPDVQFSFADVLRYDESDRNAFKMVYAYIRNKFIMLRPQ